jgi:hypothetical protein
MRPFQPVNPLDNPGEMPFGLPMVSAAPPHHPINRSFHQYTVEGAEHPMTVGQCFDYVWQQQVDQVDAFKNRIIDAVDGMRAEIQGMRQEIDELIDLLKRMDTIKSKKGIKDDKKGQQVNKKGLEDDKKGAE